MAAARAKFDARKLRGVAEQCAQVLLMSMLILILAGDVVLTTVILICDRIVNTHALPTPPLPLPPPQRLLVGGRIEEAATVLARHVGDIDEAVEVAAGAG